MVMFTLILVTTDTAATGNRPEKNSNKMLVLI